MRAEMKEIFEKLEAKRKLKPTDDRKIDAHELAYMLFYCHMFYEAIERVQQWKKAWVDELYMDEKIQAILRYLQKRVEELWSREQLMKNFERAVIIDELKEEPYMYIA